MRRSLAALVVFLSLIGCGAAVAENTSLADLKAWVGKYPADKIDGKTLWDNPALKAEVGTIMTDRVLNFYFNEMGRQVATPVEIKDDVLAVFVCHENDCMMNSATMFINLKNKKIDICWQHSREPEEIWLSSGREPRKVGVGVCGTSNVYKLYDTYKEK